MATTPEGIMALNQPQGAAPQLSYEDSYDAMRQALQQTRPDADLEMQEMLDEVRENLAELNDEQLQLFIDAVQRLYDEPENYKRYIAEAVQGGDLEQDDFPAEYDEEFLATVLVLLRDEQRNRKMQGSVTAPMEAMLPQQFARGGIAEAARIVASKGRYGDTMLAHITPAEARLLKSRGGAGTINPETGLPEYFIGGLLKGIGKAIGGVVKGVVNVAKKIVSSPIGRIVATVGLGMMLGPGALGIAGLGLSAPVAAGLASGAVTAIGGGSLKDVLVSSAVGFLGAPGGPASQFIGKYTPAFISSSPTALAAVTGAVVGTGAGMLQGQSLKDAVQSGLTQGAIAGTMTYLGGGNKSTADNAAKTAAADAADETVTKVAAGAPRDATVTNTAMRPSEVRPGEFIKTTTLSNGQVVEQAVTSSGAPLGPPVPTPAEAIGGGFDRMMAQAQGAPTGGASISAVPTPALDRLTPAELAPGSSSYTGTSVRSVPSLSGNLPPPATPASYDINPALAGIDEAKRAAVTGMSLGNTTYGEISPMGASTAGGIADVAATPYRVPEIGASLRKAITPGTMMEGLGDLFMPGPSSAQYKDMVDDFLAKNPGRTVADATSYLEKTGAVPGMLRTYGPGVVAGIGALGAMGGFTPKPPPETEFQQRMRSPIDLSGNPSAYYVQNLPGVQYDEQGNIIGVSQWNAPQTMQDIQVATPSYIGYNPMMYPTRFFNMGGIADLAGGGYPRRVGQISGPGTEKSDSIPAMLSDGEFVMTARAVRGMGNGSRREGAKKMYALMHKLEKNAARG